MTNKEIIIEDYFNIMRDDYGRIYCIQEIGDTKQLIKAIREQNEYIQTKEQECEQLKKIIDEAKNSKLDLKSFLVGEAIQNEYEEKLDQLKLQIAYKEADEEEIKRIIKPYLTREDDLEVYDLDWIIKGFCNELDQLKAEVKSKTEYIQEQRDIINQYSKEIEMYKKCQGKRASKREEELKVENEELKGIANRLLEKRNKYLDKWGKYLIYRKTLTEIKEIATNHQFPVCEYDGFWILQGVKKRILRKISEVEND
jgi:hypothetical protein